MNKHVLEGARDTLPLVFAAMPFGLVFGAMGHAQGLPDWLILCMSILVFAGASQFIAITLLASGATVSVILLVVFVVNLRHMLYGISLISYVKHFPLAHRLALSFGLTDESYAVVYNRVSGAHDPRTLLHYFSGSELLMYGNWVLCTWLGITAGNQLPEVTELGLDIAMVVAFIGIVVPSLKLPPQWYCTITAGVCAIITYHWPYQTGLLFSAFLAIIVGVATEEFSQSAHIKEHATHE